MNAINKFFFILVLFFISSCIKEAPFDESLADQAELALLEEVKELSAAQLKVQAWVKPNAIIAHRGTTDYAPQETAAAFRFAKNVGADYLLLDLLMTKDGHLVAFKGDVLANNSNVKTVFPGLENAPVGHFTLAELKSLEYGSWFDDGTYKRDGFTGLEILTLEEVINICEGKMPDGSPDFVDFGNRPGIYIRMDDPWLSPGIEQKLKTELTRLAWYGNLKTILTFPNKVDVANSKGRVIIATLQKASLLQLEEVFGNTIPLGFWLWKSSGHIKKDDAKTYAEFVNFGIEHGAHFICPNISTNDLLKPWQGNMIRRTKAKIHAFTVDTKAQMAKFTYNDLSPADGNIYEKEFDLTDGFITDRPQYAKFFYGRYYLGVDYPEASFYNSEAIGEVFQLLGY